MAIARAYTDATLKELFALSGNQCAFRGCRHVVIDEFGTVVAQIAHIYGVKPKAARYDKSIPEDRLRLPENLVVLCYAHHRATDDESIYTVHKMRELKAAHERRFGGVISGLRAGIEDQTKGTVVRPPADLGKYGDEFGLDAEGLEVNRKQFVEFLDRLAMLPPDARSVLATVIERGQPADGVYSESFEITLGELRAVLDVTSSQLGELNNILVRHGYVYVDTDQREGYDVRDPWIVTRSSIPGASKAPVFLDVRWAHSALGISPATLLVDLDWRGLDAD